MAETFLVESPDVTYSKDFIEAKYTYSTVHVCKENGVTKVRVGGSGGAWGGEEGAWRWLWLSPRVPTSLSRRYGRARPASPSGRGGRSLAWG